MKKRFIALFAGALLSLTLLAGCGSTCKQSGCSEPRLDGSDKCAVHAAADLISGFSDFLP